MSRSEELMPWLPGPLPAQMDEAAGLLARRAPDIVLLSVGGNDVGFDEIVKVLLRRRAQALGLINVPPNITFPDISQAIGTGTFSSFPGGQNAEVGMAQLDARLSELPPRLNALVHGTKPKGVFWTKYADWTTDSNGSTCDSVLTRFSRSFLGIPMEVRLGAAELDFARQEFLAPLNASIHRVAKANGWTPVSTSFASHGICANAPYQPASYPGERWPDQAPIYPGRWMRQANESLVIQGPGPTVMETNGLLHPNESGHRRVAEEVLTAILANPAVLE